MNRETTLLATAIAAVLAVLGAGSAQAATDGQFGEHVSTCTRTMGFEAEHNPGMHTGYTGWDGHTCH